MRPPKGRQGTNHLAARQFQFSDLFQHGRANALALGAAVGGPPLLQERLNNVLSKTAGTRSLMHLRSDTGDRRVRSQDSRVAHA